MDIKSAFEEFAGGESHMTGEQLRRFVHEHQGEKEPDDGFDLELLHLFKITSPFLSLEDFQYFLFSDEFNPPISTQVHHDMTAPLSHYYIYTGHNSYLTGNQLSSDCSDVPIIKALQRGVRVIELDMWPNSKRDDVNILHGRTLTAPVKLIKCLTSIKEYAFSASPYPLVLTLEDHLTPDLQAKVAQMVTEMFGDMLYYPKSEWLEEFPSPEELKNRVILSTNPPKKDLESKSSTDKDNGSYPESKNSNDKDDGSYPESKSSNDKDDGSYPECKSSNNKEDGSCPESKSSNNKEDGSYPESKSSNDKEDGSCPESKSSNDKEDGSCPESRISNDEDGSPKEKESSDEEVWIGEVKSLQSLLGRNESKYDRNELDEDEEDAEDDPNSRQKSAPEYTCLITIRAGKPKNGLRKALQVDPDKARRLSLSEQELERAAAYYGSDLIKFTLKNLLRIYPKGTRFDSSNYNPLIGWMHGAQMVAFNMQGYGKFLWLMHGLYRGNGGCGYIKKPSFLLNTDPNGEMFDPKASLPVKKTLMVKVYMGDGWHLDFNKTDFDTDSPPDFYARVGIAGVPADTTMKKTRTVEDEWTPVWDEEFTFPLTVPELALLRVEVLEYDQRRKIDFAGQTCLPVSELRPGIRSVALYDRKGVKYKSVRLLMKFILS